MSLFLGNRGTKLYKLEDRNMVSKFIKRGTNKENVWENGNIGKFWGGTREQGPPRCCFSQILIKSHGRK